MECGLESRSRLVVAGGCGVPGQEWVGAPPVWVG